MDYRIAYILQMELVDHVIGMVFKRLKELGLYDNTLIIELYELREALDVYSVGCVSKLSLWPAEKDRLQATIDQLLTL
jgi:hypothetical protein